MQNLYKTQPQEISTVIFESLVNNLGDRIRKTKLNIKFNTEEEKIKFQIKKNQILSNIDNQSQLQYLSNEQIKDQSSQVNKQLNQNIQTGNINNLQIAQNSIPFQLSVLLKQKYMNQFQQIARINKVRFLVLPKKIKIQGRSSQNIQDAQDEYLNILNNIYFQKLDQFGQQLYQSKFYTNLLKQVKINLIQILGTYYYWYEKDKINQDQKQKISQILFKLTHKMFPLFKQKYFQDSKSQQPKIRHGDNLFKTQQKNNIVEMIVKVRAKLFQNIIKHKLNQLQQKQQKQVQLSKDQKNLIIHLDAEDQYSMVEAHIINFFNKYEECFILFQNDVDPIQIQSFLKQYKSQKNGFLKNKSIQKRSNQSEIFYQHRDNFICVIYKKYQSDQNLENHQLLKLVTSIPQQIKRIKIALYKHQQINVEKKPWGKKLIIQKNKSDNLWKIGWKNPTSQKYKQLFEYLLQGHFNTIKRQNQKQKINIQNQLSNSSFQVDDSKIDETSINNSMYKQQQSFIKQSKVQNQSFFLNKDLSFKFQNYKLRIQQTNEQKNKKYISIQERIKKIQKTYINKSFQTVLNKSTSKSWRIYRININQIFKTINYNTQVQKILLNQPELQKYNIPITVYSQYSQNSQSLYMQQKKIKIQKIQKNQKLKQGYLLQTNLLLVFINSFQGSYQLPFGTYEAINYVKKLLN